MKKIALLSSAVGLIVAILLTLITNSNVLIRLDNMLWDTQVNLLSDHNKHHKDIKLIFIDQSSLDWAKETNALQWPWPREIYKIILDFCKNSGAKVVIIDMIYTENSLYGIDDDKHFATSLDGINSVGAMVLSNSQGSIKKWPLNINKPLREHNIDIKEDANIDKFILSTFSIDSISNGFKNLASVRANIDLDGIVRRSKLFFKFDDVLIPSLALASYMATHKNEKLIIKKDSLTIGSKTIPLNDGSAILNYRGKTQTHQSFNAASIIQSQLQINEGKKPLIELNALKDSYVFIGVSAPGLMDFKSTPLSSVYPGVEIHASLLDNLLNNDFFTKISNVNTFFLLLVFSAFIFFLLRIKHSLIFGISTFISFCMLVTLLSIFAYQNNIWFPLAQLLVALFLSSSGAFFMNYFIEGSQKRYIKNAFSQYLSPAVIEKLINDPSKLELGGELQPLSIFFSDIQGFTTISQDMPPSKLPIFLNDYLSVFSDIILDEGGTIDKYEGDAIIAFWNAPISQKDHALRAVRSALRCQKEELKLQEYFIKTYGCPIFTRIGINTGDVVVGNMGTKKRFDYTFIGDGGNLAARLEGANKHFGTYLLISESTKNLIGNVLYFRELGLITVVGRSKCVRVYEPYFFEDFEKNKINLKKFNKALNLFYDANLDDAYELFQSLSKNDPPAQKYLSFIDKKRQDDNFNPILGLYEK